MQLDKYFCSQSGGNIACTQTWTNGVLDGLMWTYRVDGTLDQVQLHSDAVTPHLASEAQRQKITTLHCNHPRVFDQPQSLTPASAPQSQTFVQGQLHGPSLQYIPSVTYKEFCCI
jgi:hypothetical protein